MGAALTEHHYSIIYRRQSVQLQAIIRRVTEILGGRDGYNGQDKIWRVSQGQVLEFGSCNNLGDEQGYQGRPHDLKGFDEITHFLEAQFRFLIGWMRSDDPNVRQRVICAGNPPLDSDGEWVNRFWGAWLDEDHPNPAKPGELRWYTTHPETGEDVECPSSNAVEIEGEICEPMSRTFIPSSVEDNPFLMKTGYKRTLQALPEPLRSMMLKGDFKAGKNDDPWQVIPSDWVTAAQDRWTPDGGRGIPMDSIGVDPARGGDDETVIAPRHGHWFAELSVHPGMATPNGPIVASLVLVDRRDDAPVHVDVIGIGSSVYDHLEGNGIHVIGVNGAERSHARDVTHNLAYMNKRAEVWWSLREALDPSRNILIALPPDPKLRADLCAPRWKLTQRGIQVESKEDLIKRLGRSPDRGDAVCYGNMVTEKRHVSTGPMKITRPYKPKYR